MQKKPTLDELVADAYRRSPLAAAIPYIVLALVLAFLFIWRVGTTDSEWSAAPRSPITIS